MGLLVCIPKGQIIFLLQRSYADILPSSHLLLHDDSISTRRISYILYLPNSPPTQSDLSSSGGSLRRDASFSKGWDPDWGGSLELYPVENGNEGGPPGVKRATKIDVKWGQIVLFEVSLVSLPMFYAHPLRSNQEEAIMLLKRSSSEMGMIDWV